MYEGKDTYLPKTNSLKNYHGATHNLHLCLHLCCCLCLCLCFLRLATVASSPTATPQGRWGGGGSNRGKNGCLGRQRGIKWGVENLWRFRTEFTELYPHSFHPPPLSLRTLKHQNSHKGPALLGYMVRFDGVTRPPPSKVCGGNIFRLSSSEYMYHQREGRT